MDVFLETLVKQKDNSKTKLKKSGLILGLIVFILIMIALSVMFISLSFIFLVLIIGAVYGTWYLMSTFRVEFEYIVTNGEMDVDKIIAERKRKRLVSIKFRDMDIMAPANGEHKKDFVTSSEHKTIDACTSPDEKGTFVIVTRTDKHGLIKLYFTPDDRIISSARSVAPRKVFTI